MTVRLTEALCGDVSRLNLLLISEESCCGSFPFVRVN